MIGARRLSAAICVVFATSLAHAQEGITHPSESELKNPSSGKGLCTSENEKSMFYQNYCLAIKEQLQKPCTQQLVQEIRKRFINDPSVQDKESFSGRLSCRGMHEASKSQEKFENILLQFFASVAAAESGQREYANLDNFAKADNAGKKGGLFNLSEDIIKDEKFECGCKNINSTGDGKDLTVNDAHLQATCATYVALYYAQKHGSLFGGNRKSKSKNCSHGSSSQNLEYDEPHGAACAFRSLQEIERPPNAGDPPKQPGKYQSTFYAPDLRMIDAKTANYCEKNLDDKGNIKPDGSFTLPAQQGPIQGVPGRGNR